MNLGRETHGSKDNFIVFGTAFPEQTEKDRRAGRSDAGQFVPVWKQEARDEHGRRRFHGAFTGGFSAGYFNTVGSKEGWEPTNYVSSRNARNERKQAKPEDFMDEEDLQDMANARKLVTTEKFDILGGTERELAARRQHQKEEEERGGALNFLETSLMNMFGPPRDSIGIRLLRKMGWRPGQGIGPRVYRKKLDDEDDDVIDTDITFAPRDTPIENFQPKRDTYGLGYDLSLSAPEIAEMKRLRELAQQRDKDNSSMDKKKRSAFGVLDPSNEDESRGAFGLGVFDNEYDDDIYYGQGSSFKNYHTSLYDDEEDEYTLDMLKAKQRQQQKQDEEERRRRKDPSLPKCSDGRPPLLGFHVSLSSQNQHLGKWYPPPKVPADFTGIHRTQSATVESSTPTKKLTAAAEGLFSFEERGLALGEKPIEQRSVFDYMPQHSKDKLDKALHFIVEQRKDKSQLSDFPTVSKQVANLALRGFIPFGDNPKKQARYKHYLENQAGLHSEDGIPKTVLPIPEGLTYEAGMKELDEFAKAARIFRPISSMMSGRFTTASDTTKHEVIHFEGGLKTEEEYRKEKEEKEKAIPEPKKQLSQEAEAAAMNMFGNLTRTIKPFYPNRLVCKRFNIRNPHPDHEFMADNAAGRTQAGSKDALSKESMETLLNERVPLKFSTATTIENLNTPKDNLMMKAVIPKPSERQSDTEVKAPTTGIATTLEKNSEEDEGPPLDYERPSMDIFKAIFDNSDTEEEEEEQAKEDTVLETTHLTNEAASANVMEEDDFIGPPPPPKAPTVDIPITSKSPTPTAVEPFRPMFRRASERNEQQTDTVIPTIVSEEVLVQPFKPRSSGHRRRRISVSDSENEIEEKRRKRRDEEDRTSRRHSRHHKSSHEKHKRKRSEEKSKSPERNSSSSRHKHRSSKKSHSSSTNRSSSHRHKSHKEDIILSEGIWVEKEPIITEQENNKQQKSSTKSRMRAADMW
ncbi:uncharacterized protein BX663DRAFT_503219 [Cokeromyces recurvatus]|uniref:uncharacterized protein n=1 Tax=Cokeromyces recurvatus TaxID=90255 RepID=UPI0022208416|nr:uncharacterized protein BX663DRAFT_503219 [Cokeromyces recurvatus]KAI7904699.1 hypothetical protein BX663DRAFT_503219 [Cokeromyces recurvatus]